MIEAIFRSKFFHVKKVTCIQFGYFLDSAETKSLWGYVLVNVFFFVKVFYHVE